MTKMTIDQTAAELGVSPQVLRIGIKRGVFPFASAIQHRGRTTYLITRERFELWKLGKI